MANPSPTPPTAPDAVPFIIRKREAPTIAAKVNAYKPMFELLAIDGSNFLEWREDMKGLIEMHAMADSLPSAFGIQNDGSLTPAPVKAWLKMLLLTHLGDGLKQLYASMSSPDAIWNGIEKKFELGIRSLRTTVKHQWDILGVDRYDSLESYEISLNRLVRKMILCGFTQEVSDAEKIEKTVESLGEENNGLRESMRGKYESFDDLMFDLRARQAKDLIAKDRADTLKRNDAAANVNATEAEPLVRPRTNANYSRSIQRPNNFKPKTQRTPRPFRAPMKKVHRPKPRICYSCGRPGHIGAECKASKEDVRRYRAEYEARRAQTHHVAVSQGEEGDFMMAEVNGAEARMSAMALHNAPNGRQLASGSSSRV